MQQVSQYLNFIEIIIKTCLHYTTVHETCEYTVEFSVNIKYYLGSVFVHIHILIHF